MKSNTSRLQTVELGSADQADFSIIWLHGLGADGNDFVPLVPELKLPNNHRIHFVFPHAPIRPVTLNAGMPMRAWFDIINLSESGPVDEAGINEATASIHELIEREIALGIPSNKIFLAGFSQGGCIALLSGLYFPEPLAGIIGLSTFLWRTSNFETRIQPQNKHIPIYLAHGTVDPIVPFQYGVNTSTYLKDNGHSVEFHSYPMAHTVCLEETQSLSIWLQKIHSASPS